MASVFHKAKETAPSDCRIRPIGSFRLLNPGDELELRRVGDVVKVFAFGEYVSDLSIPDTSQIHILIRDKIPFDAYLGGRDLDYIYNDNIDFASLIIFYKIEGLSPTKVNLDSSRKLGA